MLSCRAKLPTIGISLNARCLTLAFLYVELQCFALSTPVWRAGPFGHKTLVSGVR